MSLTAKKKRNKRSRECVPVLEGPRLQLRKCGLASVFSDSTALQSTEWEQEGRLAGRGGEHPEASRRGWEFGWGLKDGW